MSNKDSDVTKTKGVIVPSNNTLLISERQRGNPLIKYIKNTKYEYTRETVADYCIRSSCVLFVSIKYHLLHANYTLRRLREIGKNYRLRILLVYVDDENLKAVQTLNKLCFLHDFTLLLAWSEMECARYLETLKEYENKNATVIQEKVESEYIPRVTKMLTSIKSVNKTDVLTLLQEHGNFKSICQSTEESFLRCPGLGDKKVKRLFSVFNEPFIKIPRQRL